MSSFGSGIPAMQSQPSGSQLGGSFRSGAHPVGKTSAPSIQNSVPPAIAAAGPDSYSHFGDQYYYNAGVDFQAAASDFKPELDSPYAYTPETNIKTPVHPTSHGLIRSAASEGFAQANISSNNLARSGSIPRPGVGPVGSGAHITTGSQPITPDASSTSVSSTSPKTPAASGPDFGEINAGGGMNGLTFNVDVSQQRTRAPPHHAIPNRDHEQLLASYLSPTTFSKLLASPVGLHKVCLVSRANNFLC
ncbi:hypothetical protein BJ742DRAFT_840466 [Cladochytrium replicatum]|nr:hypothetical protein BJ742DRAFT_840466 [Cladochytrium replicatum]